MKSEHSTSHSSKVIFMEGSPETGGFRHRRLNAVPQKRVHPRRGDIGEPMGVPMALGFRWHSIMAHGTRVPTALGTPSGRGFHA